MLPDPQTGAGRAGLAAVLAEPRRAVVAVDFDGTLAPIVARPEDARAVPGATAALAALAQRVGVCALVTGRPSAVVLELAGLHDVPGLVVLGHYGLQRWHDGVLDSPDPVPGVAEARRRLAELLARAPAGVTVEDKEHSLVVHTRATADPAAALEQLRGPLRELAERTDLETVPGRFALELRPPGTDKGGALRGLAAERAPGAVVFVGDDVGDLPAFAAVDELRGRGVAGLKVCSVTAEDTGLREHADLVLDGPEQVVRFLADLAAAIGDVP